MMFSNKNLAVIMARGDSNRMGRPKGLCRLNPDDPPFVVKVSRLYLDLGVPVLVIVRQADEAAYVECLEGLPVEILSAPGGGDTAQTMMLALQWSISQGYSDLCFWAHPVDVPLVRPQTISHLLEAFNQGARNAMRPYYNNLPGHPVLMPGQTLHKVLSGDFCSLSMSAAWKNSLDRGKAKPIRTHTTDDPGVLKDFDSPEQLESFRKTKEPGS